MSKLQEFPETLQEVADELGMLAGALTTFPELQPWSPDAS